MKKYRNFFILLQDTFIGKGVIRFEDKLLLVATMTFAVLHFIYTLINIIIGLKVSIVFTSLLGTIVYSALYLLVRFISRNTFVFFVFSVVTLLFIDLVWYVNYGSQGPVLLFFIVYYSFMILLFEKRYFFLLTTILLINILGLYLVELHGTISLGFYPDSITKLNDIYTGLAMSLLITFLFLEAIKKNYIFEFERAKKSDQLKSSFVANMSHEIRTPLNAIVGFSSLMSDPDISEEDKRSFDTQIQQNSDYLLQLIEDIIDVSKIESNQLNLRIIDMDVVPVIRHVVQSFQLVIPPTRNLKVVTNLDKPSFVVKFDVLRFEQIIRNLLSNAIKFTQEGQIEVGCRKGKEFDTFWVKDTGIGIHFDHQEVIFDRFMKIDNDKQRLYRGTGIGLFITRQLVEMFKGKIWVESEIGKGSTFYFTIPV